MEGVDHIDIVKVCGCSLIGQIDRMLKRDIPDREGLELGIAGIDPMLMLMIELRQAGSHLAAAGARCSYNDQRAGRRNIIVPAEALFADDQRDVGRIALDHIVFITGNLQISKSADKIICSCLALVLGNYNTSHKKADGSELVDQSENFQIIGDADVAAALLLGDSRCADSHKDLCLVLQLQQHLQLTVRLKSRKYSGGMKIIK